MITFFENCGYVYKMESSRKGVVVYRATDFDAVEKFYIGLVGALTFEIEWRS